LSGASATGRFGVVDAPRRFRRRFCGTRRPCRTQAEPDGSQPANEVTQRPPHRYRHLPRPPERVRLPV